jgi:hypothetical protein
MYDGPSCTIWPLTISISNWKKSPRRLVKTILWRFHYFMNIFFGHSKKTKYSTYLYYIAVKKWIFRFFWISKIKYSKYVCISFFQIFWFFEIQNIQNLVCISLIVWIYWNFEIQKQKNEIQKKRGSERLLGEVHYFVWIFWFCFFLKFN